MRTRLLFTNFVLRKYKNIRKYAQKNHLSDDIRHKICQKYDKGKSILSISEELELPYKTVGSILKIYRETGRVIKITTRSRPSSVTDDVKSFLVTEIKKDVSVTLAALKGELLTEKNVDLSITTIDRAIQGLHYSFKRVHLIPIARNTTKVLDERFVYGDFILSQDENKIIFLYEMGTNCSMRTSYGRSPIGTTPRKTIRAIRSKNYSTCAAIKKTGVLMCETVDGAYNGLRFASFVVSLLEKLDELSITDSFIIMDNCVIHKVHAVRELFNNSRHSLVFLPPYSPQLNPIEEAFSKWKNLIKGSNPSTVEDLHEAILSGFKKITESDCNGFYRHMRYYALQAIKREEF